MRLNIQYVIWLANQTIKKLGIFGMLGLAITLGCCLLYVTQLLPQQNKIHDLTSQLQQVNANQNSQSNSKQNNILVKQVSLADVEKFYATFSASASLPATIDLIRENAQKQKLVLTRGDYKLVQTKAAQPSKQQTNSHIKQLAHYEMVLPVTGSYQQIRSFIAQVLYQLPALALGDVQIKRENTLNPLVDARLTFVFLLRGDAWQKSATQGSSL